MIEVDHLTKYYGSFPAVRDVSFSVKTGEILGLLGPNGAGKTTTMRILTCFFPATSGTAKVAGYDVNEKSLEVRKRLGYLPENVPLYTEMRTDQYLYYVAELKGIASRERKRHVEKMVSECGLQAVFKRYIKKLSKGYRQRVGLAQALIGDPEVLILDEPTVGLDPNQIIEIRNLIKAQAKNRTVILSTHILDNVQKSCDSVVIINKGRVCAADRLDTLLSNAQKHYQVVIQAADYRESLTPQLKEMKGVRTVLVSPNGSGESEICIETERDREILVNLSKAITKNGATIFEMKTSDLTLEDVFRRIVREES
jgi:gliding motility-associated transport system ATP-binding protein